MAFGMQLPRAHSIPGKQSHMQGEASGARFLKLLLGNNQKETLSAGGNVKKCLPRKLEKTLKEVPGYES